MAPSTSCQQSCDRYCHHKRKRRLVQPSTAVKMPSPYYLSKDDGALLPPDHKLKLPSRPYGAVHFMSTVMRQVLSSSTEAGVGATFYGCQYAVPLQNTLADLGHVQGATLIITDNECCEGILNKTVKKRRSKAMDMRFYWVKCRIAQG